jgi:hypothetical protein
VPIIERDPWRLQYFEDVACPDDVEIPTEESDAWRLYPEHRWLFDKLLVADSQGLPCGPHGVAPASYPVFSKPVYSMRGMGTGSRVLRSARDYERHQHPGHFWMALLEGEHVSSDVAVVRGRARWWRHTVGRALDGGTFDYWTVLAESRPAIEGHCGAWLERHLGGYTGMLNFETIGARIIEVHLRFADQWPDLYGAGWLDALVRLYARGDWEFDDRERRDGYSVVLFGPHGTAYRHPAPELVQRLRQRRGVTSIQITFHEDRPARQHAMPPGGFRLAVFNCLELEAGLSARRELASAFREP